MSTETTDGDAAEDVGDAARSKVPMTKRLTFWGNLVVLFGWVLVISSLLVGGAVGQRVPFRLAVLAVLFAGALNGVVAVFVGGMAARTGLASALLYRYSYGRWGAILPSFLLTFTGLIWFGVILNITADALAVSMLGISQGTPTYYAIWLVFAVLFMYPAYKSIEWIAYVDYVAAPAIVLVLLVVVAFSIQQAGGVAGVLAQSPAQSTPLLKVFTIAAGGWIVGVTLMADIARFFKNAKQAAIGSFLTWGVLMVIQYAGAAMGALVTGEWNIFLVMNEFGLLAVTFIVIFLATMSTEIGGMYVYGNLMSAPPIPKFRETQEQTRKTAILIAWVVALVLALAGIQQYFGFLLQSLAWIIAPVSITIILDYWALPAKRRLYEDANLSPDTYVNPAAYAAWVVGFLVGFYTQDIFISLLNGMVVAGLIYYGWMRFALNNETTPENQVRRLLGQDTFETPYEAIRMEEAD